jgi:hypothetical protein
MAPFEGSRQRLEGLEPGLYSARIPQLKVTQRSSGKPSGAKTMGQPLVAACNLQCLQ